MNTFLLSIITTASVLTAAFLGAILVTLSKALPVVLRFMEAHP